MTAERVESAYSASTRGIILAYRPISVNSLGLHYPDPAKDLQLWSIQ